jgi:hypothetical protein
VAIALIAWRTGGELTWIIVVAVVASVVAAFQFTRRSGRGTAAQNLWQVNLATFGVIVVPSGTLLTVLRVGFAGYCDDGCEPPRSPLPDLASAAGIALVTAAGAFAVWHVWRRIERRRSPQQGPRIPLLVPVALAWLVVGVTALPTNRLLPNPEPKGHGRGVAHEPCVTTSPAVPCRSISTLRAATAAGDVLLVWKSAAGVRGLLSHAGRNDPPVDIAAVPPSDGEDSDAVTVAPAHGGGFAVIWSEQQDEGRLRTTRVAADGTRTAPVALDVAVTFFPTLTLVTMPDGYLLFACDTPDAEHSGPRRLVALPLDRGLRARGGWREVVHEVGMSPRLAAAALGARTAAVTYVPPAGGLATIVVDADGATDGGPTEGTVAVPGLDGRGSVAGTPAPPAAVSASAGEGEQSYAPELEGMAGEGSGLRTLWTSHAKPRDPGGLGEAQQWIGRPAVDGSASLAATELHAPQLVVSSTAAWVAGYRLGARGEGGGRAADVELLRAR